MYSWPGTMEQCDIFNYAQHTCYLMEKNRIRKSHGGVAAKVGLEKCYERILKGSSKATEANTFMAQMGNSFVHFVNKTQIPPCP